MVDLLTRSSNIRFDKLLNNIPSVQSHYNHSHSVLLHVLIVKWMQIQDINGKFSVQ